MFNSKLPSNYEMPSALKKKLHHAKRTFSANKPNYGSNTTTSPNLAPTNSNSYIQYRFKNYNTSKNGTGKLTKREKTEKRNLINQQFAEIEAALEKAKNVKVAREHGNAWVNSMKDSDIDYFESELRKAHRINFIDLVLSEETTLV
uniref:Uncharacterized protein n=1 Tax=Panagrolaimus sp. ES5 TaxID=591445 RepID=A0AC34F1W4_9BILA